MYLKGLLRASIPLLLACANPLFSDLEISNISPACGEIGEKINIEGTGFSDVLGVQFDSEEAEFTVESDSSISAIAPPGSGHTHVTLKTANISTPKTFSNFYTYEGTGIAYIVNHGSNSITPIDLSTNSTLEPIQIKGNPGSIAITPDGKKAYITDDLLNEVIPFDIVKNSLGTPIPVGPLPYSIAITPDGKKAFVANHVANNVTPIDITTDTAEAPIPMGKLPFGIAISPDGKTAYVTNSGSNTVTPIDIATSSTRSPIPVGVFPFNIAITPNGSMAYVTNTGSNSVSPIDLTTGLPRPAIPVGVNPAGIAITPDGGRAYVVNSGSNSISPIDLVLNVALPAIAVGSTPAGIAITPDGKTAIVSNQNSNNITLVDLIQNTTKMVIPVGNVPFGIAVTPDQAPLAAFKASQGGVGSATIFDATTSTTPQGKIVSYSWDFGDGHNTVSDKPCVSHVYASEGPFIATLKVTNSANTSEKQIFTGQTVSNNGSESAITTRMIVLQPRPPATPTQFTAQVTKKKLFNRTVFTYHLTWNPCDDDVVKGYYLLRDGELIADIKAGSACAFKDEKRKANKRHVYTLTSYNENGQLSHPAYLILP